MAGDLPLRRHRQPEESRQKLSPWGCRCAQNHRGESHAKASQLFETREFDERHRATHKILGVDHLGNFNSLQLGRVTWMSNDPPAKTGDVGMAHFDSYLPDGKQDPNLKSDLVVAEEGS